MREPNFIDKIPADKLRHYAIGVVGWLIIAYSLVLFTGFFIASTAATAVMFVVGYAIEVYQKKTKTGKFEWWDMVAVWFGALSCGQAALLFIFD